MLKMRELSKVYRTDTVQTTALDAIDLDIADGEFVAIMGPSGCGKSTLLNMIGMLDSPSSGSYDFNGKEVAGLSEGKLADVRKESIGFIFQSFNLVDELSVRDNVELALLYHKVPAAERRARVDAVMDRVGIAHRAKHRPSQLSGGQQQRVAVARALVASPKLILADEPTGNLDTQHGEEVMLMLQTLNQEGSTIVMVTHSPAHADYAGRIVSMLDGRILQERRRAA
ncbi:ABC transporter ATP-binding protein [Sphingomonas sp. IC-56]|uniref:ABC transporter ATP-binding protein n=1 Tax=Sphingomonas sp. IC-56 TaxID=2898529 RepID=UPI001E59BB51|nr:ABC transporter ATP-binding protein [Sphingomonas sp. IC-56]MCD2324293.1 ABC transporter ATP-binding protein [Sphingomonas sp. IC-56]